jgi:hypothetical protein
MTHANRLHILTSLTGFWATIGLMFSRQEESADHLGGPMLRGGATPNPDPLCRAADRYGLERIDRQHGYAVATLGAWPVAWARRLAAPGS